MRVQASKENKLIVVNRLTKCAYENSIEADPKQPKGPKHHILHRRQNPVSQVDRILLFEQIFADNRQRQHIHHIVTVITGSSSFGYYCRATNVRKSFVI